MDLISKRERGCLHTVVRSYTLLAHLFPPCYPHPAPYVYLYCSLYAPRPHSSLHLVPSSASPGRRCWKLEELRLAEVGAPLHVALCILVVYSCRRGAEGRIYMCTRGMCTSVWIQRMEMKRSLLTLRRVATYRAHTVVPIRNSHPRCTDRISSGAGKERDSALEEHASARKGECKALRRMIMLVCLVVYEREKPVLVLSRFCLTSLDSQGEICDRADIPLSGEEGQKRRREFCAGYTCTRI